MKSLVNRPRSRLAERAACASSGPAPSMLAAETSSCHMSDGRGEERPSHVVTTSPHSPARAAASTMAMACGNARVDEALVQDRVLPGPGHRRVTGHRRHPRPRSRARPSRWPSADARGASIRVVALLSARRVREPQERALGTSIPARRRPFSSSALLSSRAPARSTEARRGSSPHRAATAAPPRRSEAPRQAPRHPRRRTRSGPMRASQRADPAVELYLGAHPCWARTRTQQGDSESCVPQSSMSCSSDHAWEEPSYIFTFL